MPEASTDVLAAADSFGPGVLPDGPAGSGSRTGLEWPRSEGIWWPWIARFFWSPAVDLHPSRREALLPGWPAEAWSDPSVLSHVSRHLLTAHGLKEEPVQWDHSDDLPVALLPQTPLALLARYLGLALHGTSPRERGAVPNEADRLFIEQRVPLYWHQPPVAGDDPDATGWQAVRVIFGKRPEAIARRFEWKTPLSARKPGPLPARDVLRSLVRKVSKELDPPWSALLATPRPPGRQVHLE